MSSYGIPYQGSKSKIAPWVVEHLPSSDVLVDLFAGGCAITHCELESVPFPVIVSEYTCPEGCVEIDSRKKRVTLDSNSNSKVAVEGLFVQERFLGEYRKRMASDRLFEEDQDGE